MKRHLIIYIALIMAVLNMNAQPSVLRKLSPSVRAMLMEQKTASPMKAKVQKEAFLCAFVKVDGDIEELFRQNRVTTLATFGDIHIVSMPVSQISHLASCRQIVRIEMGRGMSVNNDQMSKHLNIDKVYEGIKLPQAFTGKGVVMGIQDIGFDLTNPNFYNADMTEYRIKAFWDMISADTIGSKYYVGNAYEGKETLLNYAHSRDGLDQNHGSHTLGTAAGSGVGTAYRGIAYESDICLVSNAVSDDLQYIAEADRGKYTYATDALGFKYIYDYAESQGKPCVISFSEGSTQDLYGDDILYNEILDKLQGPGRILVSSAGNNSLELNYIHKPVGQESAGIFMETWSGKLYFMTTGVQDYATRLVFYGAKNDTLTVSSDWLCQQQDTLHIDTLNIGERQYILAFGGYPDCYNEDRLVTEVYIQGPTHMGGADFPLSVEVLGNETETETYRIIGKFTTKSKNPDLADAIVAKNINSPGCLPSVICVGSTSYSTGYISMSGEEKHYDYGTNGERSSFSSIGPTFDGRIKPDVMAPGANITSSTNSFYFETHPDSRQVSDLVSSYEYGGRTYYWKCDTGTSMSSPAVGGAIALWLQAKPDLTRDEVLDVLAHTCSRPDATLTYPNNQYGYGQIDVYKGLLYILGIDGIDEISQYQAEKVEYHLTGHNSFTVQFPEALKHEGSVKVYSTSGQLLQVVAVAAGKDSVHINLPAGIKGVVAVQVNGDSKATCGSTLLRF